MRFLGVWYSHFDPAVLDSDRHLLAISLKSLAEAAESSANDVEIRTCTWHKLGEINPFIEHLSFHQIPNHMGIALQILRCIYEAENDGQEADFVTFHEHDVLYPPGYFDGFAEMIEERGQGDGPLVDVISAEYGGTDVTDLVRSGITVNRRIRLNATNATFGFDPSPGASKALALKYETETGVRSVTVPEWTTIDVPANEAVGIANHNYIGLRRTGWCDVNQRDEPLHQLALRWDEARTHFEGVIRTCVLKGACNLEFNAHLNVSLPFDENVAPGVHINHGRTFSSHGNIYRESGPLVHQHWGALTDYWHEEWP